MSSFTGHVTYLGINLGGYHVVALVRAAVNRAAQRVELEQLAQLALGVLQAPGASTLRSSITEMLSPVSPKMR